MDIFEFAKEKEKFSEDYYLQLAAQTKHEGLQNIFKMLANEEMSHLKYIEQMQKNQTVSIPDTSLLDDAKNIFDSMRNKAGKFNFKMDEVAVYKKARKYEIESEMFYRQKAQEVDNLNQKDIFLRLADMEHKHYILLENIYSFVEKPQYFLENAEMYRFDDYSTEGTL
ncbi:MAG: ferritin family protein [Phycisphaerales bacterium]